MNRRRALRLMLLAPIAAAAAPIAARLPRTGGVVTLQSMEKARRAADTITVRINADVSQAMEEIRKLEQAMRSARTIR